MQMTELIEKAKPENKDKALKIALDTLDNLAYLHESNVGNCKSNISKAVDEIKPLMWEGVE